MSEDPAFFVARDRARRIAWGVERVLRERRLAWRGDEVGMASLSEDAASRLAEIASDARASADEVVGGRLRDRERGQMELPFAVMARAVAWRIDLAAELEEGRGSRRDDAHTQPIARLLESVMERIAAFVGTYDEKQPLPPARPVDVLRVLRRVEEEAAWAAAAAPPEEPRREPALLVSSLHGLEDLLVLAAAALPRRALRWRVTPVTATSPLALALGEGSAIVETPGAVADAATVLAFRHPVELEARGETAPTGWRLVLGAAAGASFEAALALAAGPRARPGPDALEAMRRLWDAPPVGDGPPPPERVVGWIGLLRALDAEIQRVLFPAVTRPPVRGAARALPREATRKAPLRRAWIEGLAGDIGSEAAGRADALGDRVAAGRLAARDVGLLDAAALLAVFGRGWTYAGARGDRVLGLGDLTDAEVLETARALSEAAAPRRELEAGRPVDGGALAGMERATFAVLGLLGRV